MTSKGAAAPVGYVWGRDTAGRWHVLRTAESTDATGAYRRHVRSVCGLWRNTRPGDPGRWAELSRWLPGPGAPAPRMCAECLRDVAAAARAVRREGLRSPAAAQPPLWPGAGR